MALCNEGQAPTEQQVDYVIPSWENCNQSYRNAIGRDHTRVKATTPRQPKSPQPLKHKPQNSRSTVVDQHRHDDYQNIMDEIRPTPRSCTSCRRNTAYSGLLLDPAMYFANLYS